jgi:hypothetical protein
VFSDSKPAMPSRASHPTTSSHGVWPLLRLLPRGEQCLPLSNPCLNYRGSLLPSPTLSTSPVCLINLDSNTLRLTSRSPLWTVSTRFESISLFCTVSQLVRFFCDRVLSCRYLFINGGLFIPRHVPETIEPLPSSHCRQPVDGSFFVAPK